MVSVLDFSPRERERERGCYLSFSGGKDSTVLRDVIAKTPGVYDVPSVFVDTGLEYPEIKKFATRNADVVIRPTMRFDEVIKTYGYPVVSKETSRHIYYARKTGTKSSEYYLQKLNGTYIDKTGKRSKFNDPKWRFLLDAPFPISDNCCYIMKKSPAKKYERSTGRTAFIGSMATESMVRTQAWLHHGCNAFEGSRKISTPLSFWDEQDVLAYIVKYNIPYCDVYGDIKQDEDGHYYTTGVNRTGCMFCMFGCHLEKEPNRFQRMKETHPVQYKYCFRSVEEKGLGLGKVLDYMNVPY